MNIVGDISSLGKLPGDVPDPARGGRGPRARLMVPVEAAARATLGAFIAGGAGGQTAEEIVRELDARSLAKVLASALPASTPGPARSIRASARRARMAT